MKKIIPILFILLCFNLVIGAETYKKPPQEIIDILDAPAPPQAWLSPSGDHLLLADYETMPSIAYLAQPLLRIAGLRLLPGNNSAQKTSFIIAMRIKDLKSGELMNIRLPENARSGSPKWSHDGRRLAFLSYREDRVELWGLELGQTSARRLTARKINCTLDDGFAWLPDNDHLIVLTVADNRGPVPQAPGVPTGPVVQENSGNVARVRTYQDLLKTPHDEALFDYYCNSQIVELGFNDNTEKLIREPGIYTTPQPSPDGRYYLLYKVKKPYSYLVPVYRFSQDIEVIEREGDSVYRVADRPLAETIPLHGVVTGPRSVRWRALQEAELVWVEALDGGDPMKPAQYRDQIMRLASPFEGPAETVMKIPNRFYGLDWLDDGRRLLVNDYDWKKRWRRTYLYDLSRPQQAAEVIFDLSRNDRYGDPGQPVYSIHENGDRTVRSRGDFIFLAGKGGTPKGDLPFLNKFDLNSKKARTLFRCSRGSYEYFVGFSDFDRGQFVTRYESKTEPPNFYTRTLGLKEKVKLTDYQNPAPQLSRLQKRLIKYRREDGVELSGTLYLPPDYQAGTRLPLLIWAYPREYSSAKIAGQIKGSPDRFTFFRGTSPLFFVTRGYAVLYGAQMPVIGDAETMNNTFIEQIVASAKAAIDYLDSLAVIDPQRVGVAGHSYGAFMTANLLAHSDLFAAGIARSGAYNRTLTPFGFQSERRTLWEAPQVYFKVSPFMHADKVNEPLLLIHGQADNNSGTFPIQSKRFYHALKGHGATVRLVLLPHESHGYRARESVLHVLAEMFDWFDKYVKNRPEQPRD